MKPPKQKQPYFFAFFLVISLIIFVLLSILHIKIGVFWFFGIVIGFTLQRSKFCFTAAFRDIILFRIGAMTKGLLITIFISTIGFFIIRLWSTSHGLDVPGNFDPVGWHTVVGATLFGIGMVIAGGCASGTLMRMGEGYMIQWLAFWGLILGSIFGSYQDFWWSKGKILLLDQMAGLWTGFFGQLIFIGVLYFLINWWENKV